MNHEAEDVRWLTIIRELRCSVYEGKRLLERSHDALKVVQELQKEASQQRSTRHGDLKRAGFTLAALAKTLVIGIMLGALAVLFLRSMT